MNKRHIDFFDEVTTPAFGPYNGAPPSMRRDSVERLLLDDVQRRLMHGRAAARAWSVREHADGPVVTAECLLVTHAGLVYGAGLSPRHAGPRRILYYFATPPALFESLVERASDTSLLPGSAVAVDSRLGEDLGFPWPLDAALRRLLDEQPVFRMESPALR